MGKLYDYAKNELRLLSEEYRSKMPNEAIIEFQEKISEGILKLVEVYENTVYSERLGEFVRATFDALVAMKPLTPIQETDEFVEVAPELWQSKRCGTIFKSPLRFDGKPYTIEGKVFSDDGGKTFYATEESWEVIEFPYIYRPPQYIVRS